jgi:succinyl-diaminopimelate desuccinylase
MEESLDEVRGELHDVIKSAGKDRDTFRYEIREMFSVQPSMTDHNAPVVSAVAKAIKNEIGCEPAYVVSPGTYDQKHIDRIGRLKNCIAYGPGILDLAHQPDEYVGIQDMIDSAKVMGQSIVTLLGSDGRS